MLTQTNRLNAIIELLSRRPELRQIDDAFAVAWQHLIEKPFECATKMRTADQDARLIKSLFLCQVSRRFTNHLSKFWNLKNSSLVISMRRPVLLCPKLISFQ